MARTICHHNGRYNIYCSISDSFIYSSSLSKEQLIEHIREEHGQNGIDRLDARLNRAHIKGHSSVTDNESLEDFLSCNRCGKNERKLSYKKCIQIFLS